jgi:amino acid adenylation domain-containing protein
MRQHGEHQEYFHWEQGIGGGRESLTGGSHFPFCFAYHSPPEKWEAGEISFSIIREYACIEPFNLLLNCVARDEHLTAEFCYDASRFTRTDIARLAAQFETLLSSAATDPTTSIKALEMVSPAERHQLLVEFNDTESNYPHDIFVHQLFEAQAELTPHAPALVYEQQQLSYRELNERANQLGHFLEKRAVGVEMVVGVLCERSVEMVVAILAILKAGAAYLPLDASYPAERLSFMLADSGAAMLLTQHHLLARLPPHQSQPLCLDDESHLIAAQSGENLVREVSAEQLAYLIYTSGSSGRPKAVMVTQGNLLHSTMARHAYYQSPCSSFLLLSSIGFDSSVAGLFWTLTGGAKLVVPGEGVQRDGMMLVRLIEEQEVTHVLSLPSLYEVMLEVAQEEQMRTLREVIVAGEVCQPGLVERHRAMVSEAGMDNEYGPTEATVWSSVYQCWAGSEAVGAPETEQIARAGEQARAVPIGSPVANVQMYILDEDMRMVAQGVRGEIYIGGGGITRGYLGRAELTAERYLPDQYGKVAGGRLYRTGDLGRYESGGAVQFLGRRDEQVKIRGYRIELGEVEASLRGHEKVREAVVIVREDEVGLKRLVGYVVVGGQPALQTSEIRDYLREKLPEQMIPSAFVVLEEMPLLGNGKVDRRALPEPERGAGAVGEKSQARTVTEELVGGIWAEVLGLERVGVEENFFEVGGHSLVATQVMSRVREAFGIEMAVRRLFERPTVRGLAEQIERERKEWQGKQEVALRRVSREGEMPLSFAQQRLWFADQLTEGGAFYNVSATVRLEGPLKVAALEQTLAELVNRHEVLRTSFPSQHGEPVQVIAPRVEFQLLMSDLREIKAEERESVARRLAQEQAERPFDLSCVPLLRASLLRLGAEEHVVVLTMHHIISDGWSMGVLIGEVGALYNAYAEGRESPLSELEIQYADYAVWQREWLRGEVLAEQIEYWKGQLKGAPAQMELPTDKVRPAVQNFRGASQTMVLSAEVSEALKALCRREGVTLFMTLLTIFKMLLRYYSKRDDIVVGADIANRNRIEVEGLIGFFINILVLRSDLSGNPTFQELLRKVRETTLGAYAHQDLPFERLVEELRPERSLSGMPLVQTMFSFQNAPRAELKLAALTLRPFESHVHTAKRDLTLFMTETEGRLVATWSYDSELFHAVTIRHMSKHFETLVSKVIAEPDVQLVDALEMLAEAERRQTVVDKKERRDSKLKQFMNVSPRPVGVSRVSLVKTGYLDASETFPLVIQPALDDVDLIEWARGQQKFIEAKLLEHGAILFRGFSVEATREFEQFALSICPELFGEYGDLPREGVSGKVYGSTPYPPEQAILFHNESSHLQRWPLKIWFFCVQAAQQGGATPIVDCRKVYQLLNPKIRERFARKKVMYVRNYVDGLDVNWRDFFHTSDRSVVEDYCRKASIDFDWKGVNGLITRQVCDAVTQHPKTGQTVFFNQLQTHHVSCLERATRISLLSLLEEEDLPRNIYYGDGSTIEDSVVDEIRELYQQIATSYLWQERDILLLDNMLTAHGRNPYQGERKIVVAMGEMINGRDM